MNLTYPRWLRTAALALLPALTGCTCVNTDNISRFSCNDAGTECVATTTGGLESADGGGRDCAPGDGGSGDHVCQPLAVEPRVRLARAGAGTFTPSR